jgi:hypothetical protein
MAIPSGSGAIPRSAKLRKTERSALPRSSFGAPAGQAADPSGEAGRDLDAASEAQAALDVEAAFGPFLDELVAATVRLSDAQRGMDRGRVGGWRRSLSSLAERLWRLESKIVRSHQ